MANVTITQLPAAGPIVGDELVPIVQNGQTVRTTASAVAGSPVQTQTFLTLNQEPTLNNSRALAGGTGIGLVDGGAQSTLQVTLNGASGSLEAASNGVIVKTGASTVTNRSIAVSGTGLSITNGSGVSGNPTVALDGLISAVAQVGGTGLLAIQCGTTAGGVLIAGTANQINVANGNGQGGNPTISIASNPAIPGTGGMTVPVGTTAQQISGPDGTIRYNSDDDKFEGYIAGSWTPFSASGVNSFSAGTTGLTPSTPTNGDVVLGGVLNVVNGGTGENGLTGYLVGNGTSPFSAVAVIPNAGLQNDSVTYNGVNVALGSSGTITAASPQALTIGSGLSGGSYDGSSAVTIAIDSTVATLTGMQTLTNKSISGSTNTLSNIPNSSLTNSSVTVGTTAISLGSSSLTLGGLTSVAVTQDPTSALDLTTKQYVDTLVASGIHFHQPVRVESPTALTATYNNGTAGVGATLTNAGTQVALVLDGVTVAVNDRVLVYQQANATQNGIYVVTDVGSGSTNWVLTRSSDANTYVINSANGLSEGSTVFVQQGATGAGETYTCNTSGVITFGTTNITFAQISSAQIYSAGTGLTLTGTQFSLSNTGTAGTYGSASQVPVLTTNAQGQVTGVTNTSIAIAGSAVSGDISGNAANVTGVVAVANGGTGTATPSLVAGSNVTITGTWPNQTINSSGGGGGVTSFSAGTTGLTPVTVSTGAITLAGTLASSNGGTGLTTFTGANNALYSTSSSALAAGTLPVAAGGTGLTSFTSGGVLYASGTGTLATSGGLTYNGSNLINSGAYTAPSNGAGAGTKTSITGSTGTGQANATGGNGYIEVIGGGGTSAWTNFVTGTNSRRRGGVYLQAGTAQADAGGTYVNGSTINIVGSAGTNNGTSVGAGSQVFITSGLVTKTDGQTNTAASINLTSSSSTSGSTASISAGNFNTAAGSNVGSSVTFASATATTGGSITLSPGNATVSGSTVGKAYVRDPATSTDYEILTTNKIVAGTNITVTNSGGFLTIAASSGGGSCATPTVAGIVYGKTTNCGFGGGRTGLGYNANPGYAGIAIGQNANDTSFLGQNILIGNGASSGMMVCTSIGIGINTVASGCGQTHIGPIRSGCVTGYQSLFYCATSREVVRGSAPSVSCATPTVAGTVFGRTYLCSSGQTGLGYGVILCGTTGSTAVGYVAAAFGNDATAVGYYSFACAGSVVVGSCASAGSNAVSIGRQALARGCLSIVIGKNAVEDLFTSQNTIIGGNAKAWAYVECAVIIGRGAVANCNTKKATVVGAGATSTAFCGSPCSRSVSVGAGSGSGAYATAVGGLAFAQCFATAVGHNSNTGFATVAIGSSANAACVSNSVLIGGSSSACFLCCTTGVVVVGYGAYVQGACSIAIGRAAQATVACANAIGAFTTNSVVGSTVIKPMRNVTTCHPVYYNPTTGELSYG